MKNAKLNSALLKCTQQVVIAVPFGRRHRRAHHHQDRCQDQPDQPLINLEHESTTRQFKNQRFKYFKLKSKKFNKTFMLGTDDDGNFFSLDSSLDIFSETDDGDYDDDSADSYGEAEKNAVSTDVDNVCAPPSDDWQADLFGVIPPPEGAHAAWTDDCDEIDMCTDPTVRGAIACARNRRYASPSCKAFAQS
eukprot:6194639-Pleurochrysis_carterae.AAC.2